VAIYTDTTIKITLSDLEQVGGVSGTKTTTGLTFEASAQFDLNVNDITFTNTKISANEISYSSVDSSYTITITGN
jgi:hypothetical protein